MAAVGTRRREHHGALAHLLFRQQNVHDLFAGKTPPHNQADEEAHTIPRPAVRTPI
jgi:hypothetical protein